MNGLHFAAPLYLSALCLLPVLWWWLRLTPPKPQKQIFPPLKLMAAFAGRETAAAKSPWWLTALRLSAAALLICAFAQPSLRSDAPLAAKNGALALLWDNSWAAAPLQRQQREAAQQLIAAAGRQNSLVYLIPAISAANAETGPYSSAEAAARAAKLRYYALPPDRGAAFAKLAKIVAAEEKAHPSAPPAIAYLTDGMAAPGDKQAFAALAETAKKLPPHSLLWYQPPLPHFVGISSGENAADGLRFTLIRAETDKSAPLRLRVKAYDEKGRVLAETEAAFKAGKSAASGRFGLPPAYANAAARLQLADDGGADSTPLSATAAAVRLLNSDNKQKTIAVLAPRADALAQPLLSPLYYAAKALENAPGVASGKVIQADSGAMGQNIDRLLSAKPDLLIMGDIASIPPQAEQKLRQWVEQGGTLFRFGGAKLANAETESGNSAEAGAIFAGTDDDGAAEPPALKQAQTAPEQSLLPVRLRRGERSFGGSLSWEKPQQLAPFPPSSPFYRLPAPNNIRISKQILAEPSADLADKSWISLRDGTPLMTAAPLGKGRLILLHTEPSGSWSDLALSSFFVQMMQRLAQISGSGGGGGAARAAAEPRVYAPYQILAADGSLEAAPETVRALTAGGGAAPLPSFAGPPGLYGSRGALYPLNLLTETSRITPLQAPQLPALRRAAYRSGFGAALRNLLLFLAACLFIADTILSLLLKSRLAGFSGSAAAARLKTALTGFGGGRRRIFSLLCSAVLAAALCAAFRPQAQAAADGLSPAALAGKTHLAYVLTGNAALDSISKAGLENLSRFIERRTTIEPGAPVGLNPGRDELAFYPLLYWPIDAGAPMPSPRALAAADNFMQRGGTILFDTRDALDSGLSLNGTGPNTARLRAMLKNMNVPPLAAAPAENVVARSFYIMPDFPGRYRSSPLWIAASSAGSGERAGDKPRSISGGDGVSPILITANDFAAAWADDGKGGFLFPLIPDGEEQRLWSFRGGLNIVLYVLTGNYKADQARAPELLRRFGQ